MGKCVAGQNLATLLDNLITLEPNAQNTAEADPAIDRCLRLIFTQDFSGSEAARYEDNLKQIAGAWPKAPVLISKLLGLLETDWENNFGLRYREELMLHGDWQQKLEIVGMVGGSFLLLTNPSSVPRFFYQFQRFTLPLLGAAVGVLSASGIAAASREKIRQPPAAIVAIPSALLAQADLDESLGFDQEIAMGVGGEVGALSYWALRGPKVIGAGGSRMRRAGLKGAAFIGAAALSWGAEYLANLGLGALRGSDLEDKLKASLASLEKSAAAGDPDIQAAGQNLFRAVIQLASFKNLSFLRDIESVQANANHGEFTIASNIAESFAADPPRSYPSLSGFIDWRECGCRARLSADFTAGHFSSRYDELLLEAAAYLESLDIPLLKIYAGALEAEVLRLNRIISILSNEASFRGWDSE